MKPEFLNVDLEVASKAKADPFPLAEALGKKVGVLHCGKQQRNYLAAFELSRGQASLERTLQAFCELLEALPPKAAHIWKEAQQRTFDIGVQSGGERPALALRISPGTLARISALGAKVAFTVYPFES